MKEDGTVWPPPPSLTNPEPAPKEPVLERIWILLLIAVGEGFAGGGLDLLTRYFRNLPVHWSDALDTVLIMTVALFATYMWMRSLRRKYRLDNMQNN